MYCTMFGSMNASVLVELDGESDRLEVGRAGADVATTTAPFPSLDYRNLKIMS